MNKNDTLIRDGHEYLSSTAAAAMLGCSRDCLTMRSWRTGNPPAYRFYGSRLWFRRDDILEILEPKPVVAAHKQQSKTADSRATRAARRRVSAWSGRA